MNEKLQIIKELKKAFEEVEQKYNWNLNLEIKEHDEYTGPRLMMEFVRGVFNTEVHTMWINGSDVVAYPIEYGSSPIVFLKLQDKGVDWVKRADKYFWDNFASMEHTYGT